MKRSLAIMLLCILSLAAYTQDGNLKKQTYFRIGYSLPSWKYLGHDDKSDWDSKRVGGVFEVGNIFMLNSIKLSPGMRIGINVDYLSVNYHRFNNPDSEINSNFLFIGSKIGPSFSYSPVKLLVLDVYAKFNPVWVNGAYMNVLDDDLFLGFMGIKYSAGLNVRYSILMMGVEFNPGFAKFRYYDKDEKELTDVYLSNENDNSKKTPVPGLNFTIGLSF